MLQALRAVRRVCALVGLAVVAFPFAARAEQIVVSNYGTSPNGMPFAVAFEKGYFKEFGVNVDGILSSDGGGSTIRNLLGGKLAFGEAAPSAVVTAVQGGADLRVISGDVHTVAEFVWVAMPNSPVKSAKDLKGLEAIFHIGSIAFGIHEGIGFRILLETFVFRLHPVIAAVGAEKDVAGKRLEQLEGFRVVLGNFRVVAVVHEHVAGVHVGATNNHHVP